MSIPNETFIDQLHEHQIELLEAFDSGKYNRYATEWARRHRKTTLWLNILIREACRYPSTSYGQMFPYQKEARETVWDSPDMLKRYLPAEREMGRTLSEQKMLIKFANGSILQIGGADNPDSWRGPEWTAVVFDEAKHIKQEMWTAIIRPVMAGPLLPEKIKMGVKRWVAFAYTPEGDNWATQLFDKACMLSEGGSLPVCGRAEKMLPGWYVSRLDAELANIIPKSALADAKNEMPLAVYEQEMKCARVTEEEMTLITSKMIQRLNDINWESTRIALGERKKIVSIDPAFGGDVCKLKGFENSRVVSDKSIVNKRNATEIAMAAKLMAQEIGTKNIVVDSIGNNVGDILAADEAGYNVQLFNSSERPRLERKNIKFLNQRAAAYFYLYERMNKLQVEAIDNDELRRQLPFASRYRVRGGKIKIEDKSKIKEALGCSPDEADCYVMGNWGLQFVESEEENNRGSGAREFTALGVPSHIRRWAG